MTLPSVKKLVAMGAARTASGEEPTPEQMGELKRLQGKMKTASRATLAMVAVAAFCMATAGYW